MGLRIVAKKERLHRRKRYTFDVFAVSSSAPARSDELEMVPSTAQCERSKAA
jgi:hypothetical protein